MNTRKGHWVIGTVVAMALGIAGTASADETKAAKQVAEKVPAKTAVAKKQPAKKAGGRTLIGSFDVGLVTAEPDAPVAAVKIDATKGLDALSAKTAGAEKFELGRTSRMSAMPTDEVMLRIDEQVLEADVITRVVRKNLDHIQYCYERIASRAKAPSGNVTLHFTVEPKGHVTGISVAAAGVNGKSLEKCMVKRIKNWKFPAADAPTIVDYPLVFDVAGSTLAK
jgi:TonB family protein